MFGRQALSNRQTGPAYSFGSGPARIATGAPYKRGPSAGLIPSVPAPTQTGLTTPGPIYKPTPSRKWLGDAPQHTFGTEEQRPPAPNMRHAKKYAPGPQTYITEASIGHQAIRRSNSSYSFGENLVRGTVRAMAQTIGPGPKYAVPPNVDKAGVRGLTAYTFASDARDGGEWRARRHNETPGPGCYAQPSAMGGQAASVHRTSLSAGFGHKREQKQPGRPISSQPGQQIPLEGQGSPGPRYSQQDACGTQSLSDLRSAPMNSFARAERFVPPGGHLALVTPGPGEYVI